MINRRHFLQHSALISLAGIGIGCNGIKPHAHPVLMSAAKARLQPGRYANFAIFLDANGKITNKIQLPHRAHAATYSKATEKAYFIARRPGQEIYVIDRFSEAIHSIITAPPNRHFYGHAAISPDGQFLLTTENNLENGEGTIGVRDLFRNNELVNEFPSNGIGPHELLFSTRPNTIVVANGGILTHPSQPRKKLNIDGMQPNISFLEWPTGKVINKYEPTHHQMSARHISQTNQGEVIIGFQFQGKSSIEVPQVAKVSAQSGMEYFQHPSVLGNQIKNYTASVSHNSAQNINLISCPKGDTLTIWDNSKLISKLSNQDVAGVCQWQDESYISNGFGSVYRLEFVANKFQLTPLQKYTDIQWDNHLCAIS